MEDRVEAIIQEKREQKLEEEQKDRAKKSKELDQLHTTQVREKSWQKSAEQRERAAMRLRDIEQRTEEFKADSTRKEEELKSLRAEV